MTTEKEPKLWACNFTDEDLDPIDCESSWKNSGDADLSSVSCQTKDIDTFDVGVTSIDNYEAACQTTPLSETTYNTDNYPPDLVECLQKAADLMIKELNAPPSRAFDGWEPRWEDDQESVTCLLSMNEVNSQNRVMDMSVTALSWNSTGRVIAAAFGYNDHEDYCLHKSRICMWNIDRHEKSAKKTDQNLDVDSCVTCLAFHPSTPGLLVAGTFSGDLMIWDIAKDTESSVVMSSAHQEYYGDPALHVAWDTEGRVKNKVMSITNSGRVTFWTLNQKTSKLEATRTSIIEAPYNFKLSKLKSTSISASTIAFDPNDFATFLLGTATGGIFKCTRTAATVTANLAYKPHGGAIYGIDFSKKFRNLFLTCGTDACLNIYSTLQENPLISLEPCQGYLYSCRWAPFAPAILAVGGSKGKVVFYNMQRSHLTPVTVLECNEKSIPVHSVEFNPLHKELVASGDASGLIKVWTLGSDLKSTNDELPSVIRDMHGSDS